LNRPYSQVLGLDRFNHNLLRHRDRRVAVYAADSLIESMFALKPEGTKWRAGVGGSRP
jgi:hypothetical protein